MANICKLCLKRVYPADPQINLDGHHFHKSCAKCNDCNCQINLDNFSKTEYPDNSVLLLCKVHYFTRFQLGSHVGHEKFLKKTHMPNVHHFGAKQDKISEQAPSSETHEQEFTNVSAKETTLPSILKNEGNMSCRNGANNISFDCHTQYVGVHEMYTFGRQLGRGQFACVFSAIKNDSGEVVTIKVINRSALDEQNDTNINNEVHIFRQLCHEHIIQLFAFFIEEDFYYLIMEIIEGGELFDSIVCTASYSEHDARQIMTALLSCLEHCHERDIVHRWELKYFDVDSYSHLF